LIEYHFIFQRYFNVLGNQLVVFVNDLLYYLFQITQLVSCESGILCLSMTFANIANEFIQG
jgi:hypothetical protein